MIQKLPTLFLLIAVFINVLIPWKEDVMVQAHEPEKLVSFSETMITQTRFTEELQESKRVLGYKIVRKTDTEVDACEEEKVVQSGKDGERRTYTRIVYYDGQEYSSEIDKTEVTQPIDEIRLKGSKKIYKTLDTPNGQIQYWCKLEQFIATAYDKTCRGCDEWTAIGMRQGFGVVAVDPKVIPLRSRLYIPGYGQAVAGDTGGAIKGNRIDLGFDTFSGQWGRGYVDIYLL